MPLFANVMADKDDRLGFHRKFRLHCFMTDHFSFSPTLEDEDSRKRRRKKERSSLFFRKKKDKSAASKSGGGSGTTQWVAFEFGGLFDVMCLVSSVSCHFLPATSFPRRAWLS